MDGSRNHGGGELSTLRGGYADIVLLNETALLEGESFLVLGEGWGYYPSTTEHLLRRFVQGNRFLWVDAIGCRAPEWSLYTLRRALGKVAEWVFASQNSRPNEVAIYAPPVVPLPPISSVRWWNRSVMSRGLNRRLKDLDMEQPILLTTSPIAAEVLDRVQAKLVVYYILDNYEEMPHHYSRYIRDLEAHMIEHADLLLATSQALVEKKSRSDRRVVLLPQGVDFEHFHAAVCDGAPEPQDLAKISRPRILFMGLLAPWVDVELLAKVCRAYPNASLVLIGPVRTDIEVLRNEPNVFFLGQRSYAELPSYLAHCDVALIPFRQNALTRYVNPLKLLEYMAAGLPVISTALPHVAGLNGLVYCTRTPQEFVERAGEALTRFSLERRARCIAAASENSWDRRADEFSRLLQKSLCQRVLRCV